jgi:hypothetical protein
MYQVDFVAALFGAFLLIWIARAKEGISAQEADSTVVTLEIVTDKHNFVVPAGSLRCASQEILEEADLPLEKCTDLVSEDWNMEDLPPLEQFPLQGFAIQLAVPSKAVHGAFVLPISVITNKDKIIRFRTFALNDVGGLIAVGIASSSDEPKAINIGIENSSAYLRVDCDRNNEGSCMNSILSKAYLGADQPNSWTPAVVTIRAAAWRVQCHVAKRLVIPATSVRFEECGA